MLNARKNFMENLKVTEENKINLEHSSFSNRDVYTCLKLMGDTSKVRKFLLLDREDTVEEKKISTNMSSNYFYTINAELGDIEYSFRKGKIMY